MLRATPTVGTIAVDQVEYARRHTGGIEHFGEDDGVERRDFTGLQHHRAARREGGGDLAADLVQRPVPGRDEGAHAHRFAAHEGRAELAFELVGPERLDRLGEMDGTERHLRIAGQPGRRAHLGGDCTGEIGSAAVEFGDDALEQGDALRRRGLRKGVEGGTGGGHRAIDIGLASQADLRNDLFRRWILDVEQCGETAGGVHLPLM